MRPSESIPGDHEQGLDEIVLAYLKAKENDSNLDEQVWIDRYPDLRGELAEFFKDQNRIERLADLLNLLTDAPNNRPIGGNTLSWPGALASKSRSSMDAGMAAGQVVGDYELLEEIGKGGMGLVYKARQRSLKRVVALKMMLKGVHASAEELIRFRSEAEAVARLQHPNIVQIYEVGEHDESPFFSLEFIEGENLKQQLDGTPLPPRSSAQLVRTLAQAIQFAHQQGIVHRDLKPANILLASTLGQSSSDTKLANSAPADKTADKTAAPSSLHASLSGSRQGPMLSPKITDFGLAKYLNDDCGQTKTGAIVGTPSYMAPEQAGGQKTRIGPATDIYGLGAIMYELLTGRPPFKAATPWETVNQVLHNEPVAPHLLDPKVDRDLETICLKCLQKDPLWRYESAQTLGNDLQRYLEGRPILARPVGGGVKFWRLCRRHPGTATSLAFAIAALLGLLISIALFNQRLKHELQQNEAINRELQMTLTRQVANRIDNDLRQLVRIPTLAATTLSLRADWREDQLEKWMCELLSKDDRLFGTAIAFEPRAFDGTREDYCMYAFRGKERLETKMLLPPTYIPIYRDHAWYKDAKVQQRGLWTEPFLDVEGGGVPMVTYSAPIWRDDKFAGVVTADLSVAYFAGMRRWLDDVNLGRNGYAFVISPSGTFISHPDPNFQMPKKIAETRSFQEQESLRTLTRRLADRETGFVRADDPSTGKGSVFYFAPIVSAQWSFVAVFEE